MHAYAGEDPVFRAMNARGQRETGGALGDFCVRCHAPMALAEGATTDGLNLDEVPAALRGVTCTFCHTATDVVADHDNGLVLSSEPVMFGPFADPVANEAHGAAYSPLHDRDRLESARMCGSCHDIVTPKGAAIERTFAEWQGSVFSHADVGTTCGQCHMEQSEHLVPVADAPGVYARRLHRHDFPAVDTALTPFPGADTQPQRVAELLATTLQTALCVKVGGVNPGVRVIVDNVAAGHAFPSGSGQDRRLWAEVIAYQGDVVTYQSGVVSDGASPLDAPDDDLWLIRDCMLDEAGDEVHMFWEAAATDGNLFPAQPTFDPTDPRFYMTHVEQRYPRNGAAWPGTPDRVTLRMRLQPIGLDVLDDLVASGDLDPAIRAAMPTLDLGREAVLEWTPATATELTVEDGEEVRCVTTTNLNLAAGRIPAPARTRCAP